MSSHTSAALLCSNLLLVATGSRAVTPRAFAGIPMLRDMYHAGSGKIVGTVKEAHTPYDTPVVRRVRLYRKRDGLFIREVWSAPDGTYLFNAIDITIQYYVLSFDHLSNYNAVVKDSITPEAM